MTLSFPNSARTYDEAHSRIRFVGHDGMFEVKFFVLAEVLAGGLSQRTATEQDYLASFDAIRSEIRGVQARLQIPPQQKYHFGSRSFQVNTLEPLTWAGSGGTPSRGRRFDEHRKWQQESICVPAIGQLPAVEDDLGLGLRYDCHRDDGSGIWLGWLGYRRKRRESSYGRG